MPLRDDIERNRKSGESEATRGQAVAWFKKKVLYTVKLC